MMQRVCALTPLVPAVFSASNRFRMAALSSASRTYAVRCDARVVTCSPDCPRNKTSKTTAIKPTARYGVDATLTGLHAGGFGRFTGRTHLHVAEDHGQLLVQLLQLAQVKRRHEDTRHEATLREHLPLVPPHAATQRRQSCPSVTRALTPTGVYSG